MWWSKNKETARETEPALPELVAVKCMVADIEGAEFPFFATTVKQIDGRLELKNGESTVAVFPDGRWKRFWVVTRKATESGEQAGLQSDDRTETKAG